MTNYNDHFIIRGPHTDTVDRMFFPILLAAALVYHCLDTVSIYKDFLEIFSILVGGAD